MENQTTQVSSLNNAAAKGIFSSALILTLINSGFILYSAYYFLFTTDEQWRGSTAFTLVFLGPIAAAALFAAAFILCAVAFRKYPKYRWLFIATMVLPLLTAISGMAAGTRYPW